MRLQGIGVLCPNQFTVGFSHHVLTGQITDHLVAKQVLSFRVFHPEEEGHFIENYQILDVHGILLQV
jgi:hypothetical protein